MLKRFAVTNYRGFAQRIEWDLSSPSNYTFNGFAIKDGTIKNGIIYGPNGSGKSNLGFAVFDIVNHLTQKRQLPHYYDNFVYAGNPNGTVDFEYTFSLAGNNIQYNYSKDSTGALVKESMTVNEHTFFSIEGNNLTLERGIFPRTNDIINLFAVNANRASVANYLLSTIPLDANAPMVKMREFVDGMLWFRSLEDRNYIGLETGSHLLDEYIIQQHLVEDFAHFLQTVSGQTYTFAKHEEGEKRLRCLYEGKSADFHQIASTGTHTLELLYFWLQHMDKATFVFIDEFDAFYHFALSWEVCKRLFALDCQVYLSSHNTHIISNDLLRPDAYFLLDKNVIRPLNKCTKKELREAHNIEKIFKAGGFYVG